LIIEQYKDLSARELLQTSKSLYIQNRIEDALAGYNLLFDMVPSQQADIEHQKILTEAYYTAAIIHYYMNNLRVAYELALKALQLSESINETKDRPGIYVVLANIYNSLDRPDFAKAHHLEALNLRQDSSFIALVLNNLGSVSMGAGNLDEAFFYLEQSRRIAEQHRPTLLGAVWNNLASYYKERKMYDSAFISLRMSLNEAKRVNDNYATSATFSTLGELFLELNQLDSARFYIKQSNDIAIKHDFKAFLMQNYLMLSEIAEKKGDKLTAFDYFKLHSELKNSTLSHDKIVEINQLRRFYENQKTNQQIEKLTIEQRFRKQIMRYQWCIILIISIMLAFVFVQNRRLNTAYRKLFEKNVQIGELQKDLSETRVEKYQSSSLSDEQQKNELLAQIYTVMEDTAVVCDPDFSLEKMATILKSNRMYISQVINTALNKNFRTFINDYRIREAQRLFAETNASKFTVESVSLRTGFKSRTSFIAAFKDVTGVSPSFYLKLMQER
jgi:AraC-like DNA-binding protein